MNLGRENEKLEFKKSTNELKDSMDDIVSMLNKHGEGVLYFGVKNDGEVVGINIGQSTIDDVARITKEAIKPMIYPQIEEIKVEDKSIIKVSFKGSELPYSSYGRYYKRVIDRAEEMTPDELKSLLLLTDVSSRWENNLTQYTLSDIDHEALANFYKAAISSNRLEELTTFDEKELLSGLGLLVNNHLTNAGYYLFSSKKPVTLKMATYVTDERISFSDIKRVEDNIFNLIRIANSYIKERMNWEVTSLKNTTRVETPEIPLNSLREIIVNSFAHADYRAISEHEIAITPSEIEIYNPGEFPLNLTPLSFINTHQKSLPRNKVILNTLFKSKDVEMFGSGFKKVFKECKENNLEFSYDISKYGFSFIFFRKNNKEDKNNYSSNNNGNCDNNYNKTTFKYRKSDLEIIELLKDNPLLNRSEIASKINKDKRTVQRAIDRLKEANKIIRVGSKKTGYYKLL